MMISQDSTSGVADARFRPFVPPSMLRPLAFVSVIWLQVVFGFGGVFGQSASELSESNALNQQAVAILKTYCHRCHGASQKLPDFDVLDLESLTKIRGDHDSGVRYVTPGDLDSSEVWQYVDGDGAYMPMEGSPEADTITKEDREVIKQWIIAGARFPERKTRPLRTRLDDLTAIRDHLTTVDPGTRRQLRFFTFSHLANNNKAVSDFDLQMVKAALSKLLNSLSWKSQIVLPTEVAKSDGTIFAIDLRDYGWSGGREWLQIVNHDPYGLNFRHVRDTATQRAASDIEMLSGIQTPVVRADWFIFSASRPPLYHDLLKLPTRVEDLEALLGVDTHENIQNNQTARAGFGRSGVSKQNRMVERHEADFGAYWISYDFLPRRGRGDLIRFPLGPKFDKNQFNRHAFEHDGGEAVFNLPNGLQGYYLLTADGDRIDGPAPADVVYDSAAISGTPAIINGVSCMNCHREGMVSGFRDEIRDSEALAGEAAEKVKALYVEQDAMERLVRSDRQRFLVSLEKAMGVFLRVGDNAVKTVDEFPDPIGQVVQRYQSDLGPREVALELGLKSIDQIANQIKFDRDLRKLGLGTLIQARPGTIKRARWEAVDGTSFFQDTAVELGLGTPILPGSSSLPDTEFNLHRHPLRKLQSNFETKPSPVSPAD